ncbi:MAG: SGNH hydrolase domain-containing protein [Sodalis sp. (in: enterobacteria)]|uniref:SGNH hydrolase domain-containing protein n=1 Tax=Sodalis sp. (in: enterobacteria) TaxID=1898979 RepID=UPI0039E3CCB9
MQKKCYSLKKSFLILVLIPAIMLLVLAPLNERYNGFKERFGSEYLKIESTQKKHISPYRNLCIDNNTEEENKKCIIGSPNSNKKAFLIGDSNSNHFWNFVDVLAKDAGISIVVNGTSSCLTLS